MKHRRESSRARRWSGMAPGTHRATWFIAGRNGVRECLLSPHVTLRRVWLHPSAGDWLNGLDLPARVWQDVELTHTSKHETVVGNLVQGVGVLVEPPTWGQAEDLLANVLDLGRNPFILALDQVEDPMNLGQILRTTEGAGVDFVLLPKKRSVQVTQTVAQVSQGAFAWVPVCIVNNLRHALEQLKASGVWVYGCHGGGGATAWCETDLCVPLALVLGSEGRGLRRLTAETCDGLLALPMAGHLESLNVSASTAAFLYEVVRQRHAASASA